MQSRQVRKCALSLPTMIQDAGVSFTAGLRTCVIGEQSFDKKTRTCQEGQGLILRKK